MSKLKKIIRVAAPIALNFIPGVGTLAGAALGAGLGALGGGGFKGALLGGVGGALGAGGAGGLGGALGSRISSGLGLAGAGAQTIGRGLSGALLGGALGGKKGAILGGLGGALSSNFGDIKNYASGKLNELGNFTDRNLGVNSFGPSSESLLAAPATSYAPNITPEMKNQVENSINYWQTQVPSYSGEKANKQSGTSTDAGGQSEAPTQEPSIMQRINNVKFSDVLAGINDYTTQDEMQDEQMKALRRAETAYSPYMAAGGQGLAELMRGYNPGDLTQDPSYQFRLAEGQKALERSMAARGMLGSGQAMKAVTDYGQNMASTAYDDAYRNWFLRNSALANYGNQNINNMANIYGQMGDVSASSPLSNNSFLNALLAGQYGGV